MRINYKLKKNLKRAIFISIVSLFAIGFSHPVIAEDETKAEDEITEIEDFCSRSPHNSACEDKDSHISLEKWEENKTTCSLATEWNNEEKKCRIVVSDRQIEIYVEDGAVSEYLSNTFKTRVITISLDEIFSFDTQWWVADVNVASVTTKTSEDGNIEQENNSSTRPNSVGIFSDLQIGYIPNSNNSEFADSEFLIISSKNLHQILEQMETWRYYLPDLTVFAQRLKSSSESNNTDTNISSNIAQLKQTNKCPRCNLVNADLTGLDLENANLQGANLAGANLTETNLKQAYLVGANLDDANLNDVDLETANLIFASLDRATLIEANLKGTNLQYTSFKNADLTGADLKAEEFKVTYLKNANLDGANLTDADLNCANLQSASLKNANLTNADLRICGKVELATSFKVSALRLNNAGVPYSFLNDLLGIYSLYNLAENIIGLFTNPGSSIGLFLQAATINYTLDTNLSGANLSGADLTGAKLDRANFTDINMSNVVLVDTKFSDNNLSNANFIDTDVNEVKFKKPLSICEAMFSDNSVYEEHCQEEEEEETNEE